MKSIPHTFNTSTDMFKHTVRLENHSDLRDIIKNHGHIKLLTKILNLYGGRNIGYYCHQIRIAKIKLNKLLAARIIVSVHTRKGRAIGLKNMKCQLNDDIWLYQNNILGEIFP